MMKEGLNALVSVARNLDDMSIPKIEHIEISISLGSDTLLLNIEKGEGETMERSMDMIAKEDPEMSENSQKMLLN